MMNSKILLGIVFSFSFHFAFAQFKQNDTLFFVREISDEAYHAIFIDSNKNSVFYNYVSDFTINDFAKNSFNNSIDYLRSKKIQLKKKSYYALPEEWVMLVSYKGNMYVNSPNDYYSHYKMKLTDSVLIHWDGEGPQATYVKQYHKIDSITFQFSMQSIWSPKINLTIKYWDKSKGIAVFKFYYYNIGDKKMQTYFQLMCEVKKMRNIPILINYSDTEKAYEVDVDNIDYSKYFKIK